MRRWDPRPSLPFLPLLTLMVLALSVLGTGGCDPKPSCKRLHEQISKCEGKGQNLLPQEQFVAICEKRKDRQGTRAEIACSGESSCKAFRQCLQRARDAGAQALLQERWKEVTAEVAAGRYTKAFTFCDVRKDDLDAEMLKRCEAIPREAVAKLSAAIEGRRDRGEVPVEASQCWELKKLASRVGPEARKAADDLCEEMEVARRLAETRKEVTTLLTSDSPYLPYHCQLPRVEEMVAKVQSPYAKKAQAEAISLCYVKLGKVLFEKRVPSQKRCEVRDLYQAVTALGVTDPAIDPWMQKAREHCETPPDAGGSAQPK